MNPIQSRLAILGVLWVASSSSLSGEFPKASDLLGPDFLFSTSEVQELHDKAEDLDALGDHVQALRLLEKALELVEAAPNPNQRDMVNLLNSMGEVCRSRGEIDKSERLLNRALALGQKHLGNEHPVVAASLNAIGLLKRIEGKYGEAIAIFERCLPIWEKVYGKRSFAVSGCLANLATVYLEQGEYRRALALLEQSATIVEQVLGADSPLLAQTLNNLAAVHASLANFETSISLHKRSLAIREHAFGRDHSSVAESLNNIATIYSDLGNSAQAAPLLERSVRIMEKVWGTNHPKVAVCLENLAELYEAHGDYERQLPLLERSYAIKTKSLGKDHPDVARILGRWAKTYRRAGDNEQAVSLLERCLKIRLKAFGNEHPLVANTLEQLGAVFLDREDYTNALVLFQRAFELREKAFGNDHPTTAVSLAYLGLLWQQLGRHDRGRDFLRRCLMIEEKVYGPLHPDVIRTRTNIAFDYALEGNTEESIRIYFFGFDGMRKYLAGQLGGVSTRAALFMVGKNFSDLEIFHSLCARSPARGPGTEKTRGAEVSALSKALYEEVKAAEAALEADRQSSTRELRKQLIAVQAELAGLPESKIEPAQRDARRRELQDELNLLEAQLTERVGLVAQTIRERNLTLSDIARNLPPGTALADFVQYRRYDFAAKTNAWKEQRYAAYLTFPLARDSTNVVVERVDLGEAAPINDAVELICRRMAAQQYRAKDLAAAIQRLSDLVYVPLAKHLTNVSHLIICPDGQLSRVPFELLRHEGKYLIEKKTISYVTSGREIVRLGTPLTRPAATLSPSDGERHAVPGKSLVMGNPDFDLDLGGSSRREAQSSRSQPSTLNSQPANQSLLTSAATRSLSRSYRGFEFARLPEAEAEARTVAGLLGANCVLHVGAAAREAELKSVVSPRVLHLATHGFFLSDHEFKRTNALPVVWSSAFTRSGPPDGGTPNGWAPRRSSIGADDDWENPMVRCGIALAGANRAQQITNAVAEDGLLTGLEASLLNLQGTELVILSACDSGSGEVKIGEGVMSLRRAFRIAGAETVLASHWKVSDKATGQLMSEFMRRWRAGEPRAKAWREAQLSLLRSKDFSDPYFWAAFTLTGRWN